MPDIIYVLTNEAMPGLVKISNEIVSDFRRARIDNAGYHLAALAV